MSSATDHVDQFMGDFKNATYQSEGQESRGWPGKFHDGWIIFYNVMSGRWNRKERRNRCPERKSKVDGTRRWTSYWIGGVGRPFRNRSKEKKIEPPQPALVVCGNAFNLPFKFKLHERTNFLHPFGIAPSFGVPILRLKRIPSQLE